MVALRSLLSRFGRGKGRREAGEEFTSEAERRLRIDPLERPRIDKLSTRENPPAEPLAREIPTPDPNEVRSRTLGAIEEDPRQGIERFDFKARAGKETPSLGQVEGLRTSDIENTQNVLRKLGKEDVSEMIDISPDDFTKITANLNDVELESFKRMSTFNENQAVELALSAENDIDKVNAMFFADHLAALRRKADAALKGRQTAKQLEKPDIANTVSNLQAQGFISKTRVRATEAMIENLRKHNIEIDTSKFTRGQDVDVFDFRRNDVIVAEIRSRVVRDTKGKFIRNELVLNNFGKGSSESFETFDKAIAQLSRDVIK